MSKPCAAAQAPQAQAGSERLCDGIRAGRCSGDGAWEWNLVTGEAHFSASWAHLYGFAQSELSGHVSEWSSRIHGDDYPRVMEHLENYLAGRSARYAVDLRMRGKDGGWKWVLTRGVIVERDAQGKPLRMAGTNIDISAWKDVKDELRMADLLYKALGSAILVLDQHCRIVDSNGAFCQASGFAQAQLQGKSLLHFADLPTNGQQDFLARIEKSGQWQGQVLSLKANGERIPEWMFLNTIFDNNEHVVRRIALFSDVTVRKCAEEATWLQANIDQLTGLTNRHAFFTHFHREITRHHAQSQAFAILFIDLDGFKEINDVLGHQVGDRLLQLVAQRIAHVAGDDVLLARIGGDEFAAVRTIGPEGGDGESFANGILEALADAFEIDDESIYISASIGMARFPDHGGTVTDLLKKADQAMYAAKRGGKNQCCTFTESLLIEAERRQRLIRALRQAIDSDSLSLQYQPIIDLGSARVTKIEALLRWTCPKLGPISPAEFIPLAEESGLVLAIGDRVFREATQFAAELARTRSGPIDISINVSPVQFQSPQFSARDWLRWLEQIGLSAHHVILEITEGFMLNASESTMAHLAELKGAGIRIAIDDFGTGYCSMAYLQTFEVDFLKIDKAFISHLASESSERALTEAIIVMAHKLGLEVVAEGVETAAQYQQLQQFHCDFAQGYLVARPLNAEDLLAGLPLAP